MKWPEKGTRGRFRIACSCGRWEYSGTSEEIAQAAIRHDDAPLQSHIVTIRGQLPDRVAPNTEEQTP